MFHQGVTGTLGMASAYPVAVEARSVSRTSPPNNMVERAGPERPAAHHDRSATRASEQCRLESGPGVRASANELGVRDTDPESLPPLDKEVG